MNSQVAHVHITGDKRLRGGPDTLYFLQSHLLGLPNATRALRAGAAIGSSQQRFKPLGLLASWGNNPGVSGARSPPCCLWPLIPWPCSAILGIYQLSDGAPGPKGPQAPVLPLA